MHNALSKLTITEQERTKRAKSNLANVFLMCQDAGVEA